MSPSTNAKDQAKSDGNSHHDVDGSHNEWKFEAPYKIHENTEDGKNGDEAEFKALYEASCHCGRVKYQLSREAPLSAKYCHCTTCQVLHGAPFQWAAIFHKTDINFTHGHHDLVWYDPGEQTTRHKLPCKITCAYCRAPIMDEGRNMILLYPSLIKWKSEEEKKKFAPQCHMFYTRRVLDINDGLPKWSELNDKSDLIADSPPELIKKRKREQAEEEEMKGKDEDGEEGGKENGHQSKSKKKNGDEGEDGH